MGAHSSSHDRESPISTFEGSVGSVLCGKHSKLPGDVLPYPGQKLEYRFTNVTAEKSVEAKYSCHDTGNPVSVVTTDQKLYQAKLGNAYQDGFKLTKFQTIPGLDNQTVQYFEGILTKPQSSPSSEEEFRLEIVKSYIRPHEFFAVNSWSSTQESNIFVLAKMHEMSEKGGRFISIEPTGKSPNTSSNEETINDTPAVAVDLFFHAPLHPNPPLYVYRSIHVPVTYSMIQMNHGFSMHDLQYQCHTNFYKTLEFELQHGWKLVDIIVDSSALSQTSAFVTGHMTMNSVWFFEKEAQDSKITKPLWEGTIITYQHTIKDLKHGKKVAKTTWDPLLVEMGQRGWELACILETPEIVQSGANSKTITLLLFFQRPIISSE